jgi:hypothetical protein
VIINYNGLLEPVKVEIPKQLVQQWITRFEQVIDNKPVVITGQTQNVSHVPCEFLLVKSKNVQNKVFVVGVDNEQQPIVALIEEFYTFAAQYELNALRPKQVTMRLGPEQKLLDELASVIQSDVFFEVASWRKE